MDLSLFQSQTAQRLRAEGRAQGGKWIKENIFTGFKQMTTSSGRARSVRVTPEGGSLRTGGPALVLAPRAAVREPAAASQDPGGVADHRRRVRCSASRREPSLMAADAER